MALPIPSCGLLLLLAVIAGHAREAAGVAETNCYQFGSGGWDLIYWGDPGVRLPPGGAIPICNSGFGSVLFRWRHPAGVFLIPSDQCPGAFEAPFNETYTELAPVSAKGEFNWVPPRQPAGVSYWLTSQVPGNCEAGVKLRVDVVSVGSSAESAWQQWKQQLGGPWLRLAAPLLAAAFVLLAS